MAELTGKLHDASSSNDELEKKFKNLTEELDKRHEEMEQVKVNCN